MAEKICGLYIMTSPIISQWIIGLNFFQNYYIVFDNENKRVGLAPSKNIGGRAKDFALKQ